MEDKKRLSAFTLIELLIALSLSSIVLMISIAALLNTQYFLVNLQKNNESLTNFISEVAYMKNDVENATLIQIVGNEVYLNNNNLITIYNFQDTFPLRKRGNRIIRFTNKAKNVQFVMHSDFSNLVQGISFDMEGKNRRIIPVYIRKEYTSATLVNLKTNSIEY